MPINQYLVCMQPDLFENPLFVFALEVEAADLFTDYNPLFVGVGKVNAAYQLTKRIGENKPSVIINLGSAGSNTFRKGSVVCCTQFVQRDMDATGIGCNQYQTPFSEVEPILNHGIVIDDLPHGICGTGDNFEIAHSTPIYNVIDMEAYALAYIAHQENIPYLCLKYISDGADDNAADDWSTSVKNAARSLRAIIDKIQNK